MVDSEVLQVYMKPPAHEESKAPSKGFVVRDAPWTTNSTEKVRLCSTLQPLWLWGPRVRGQSRFAAA